MDDWLFAEARETNQTFNIGILGWIMLHLLDDRVSRAYPQHHVDFSNNF